MRCKCVSTYTCIWINDNGSTFMLFNDPKQSLFLLIYPEICCSLVFSFLPFFFAHYPYHVCLFVFLLHLFCFRFHFNGIFFGLVSARIRHLHRLYQISHGNSNTLHDKMLILYDVNNGIFSNKKHLRNTCKFVENWLLLIAFFAQWNIPSTFSVHGRFKYFFCFVFVSYFLSFQRFLLWTCREIQWIQTTPTFLFQSIYYRLFLSAAFEISHPHLSVAYSKTRLYLNLKHLQKKINEIMRSPLFCLFLVFSFNFFRLTWVFSSELISPLLVHIGNV